MEYREFGRTGMRVSALALGTWAMGNDPEWWGAVDDNESIAAIHTALDAGVNLIDSAPAYGRGQAETLLGKALLGQRKRALIVTKCGLVWDPSRPESPISRNLTAKSIFAECEASLRRLRTDVIDVYFCHWPDPETPLAETIETLERLREQGKVRAIGLSNYGCEALAEARRVGRMDALQPAFNMFDRAAADDLLPYCQEHHIAVMAYGPLCKGLLTGRFRADTKLVDLRARDPQFIGPRYRRNLATVDRLRAIAEARQVSLAQLVLNWTIHQPGVTVALVGAKRPSQVADSVEAVGWRLTDDELQQIEKVLAERDAAGD
jgi:aryl-alcohol dehydrogenase-like predicted oxidoreductase